MRHWERGKGYLFYKLARRTQFYNNVGWSMVTGMAKGGGGTPNMKLCITISFLELKSPDFAWKSIWTVKTENKVAAKNKTNHNSLNFHARSSRYLQGGRSIFSGLSRGEKDFLSRKLNVRTNSF